MSLLNDILNIGPYAMETLKMAPEWLSDKYDEINRTGQAAQQAQNKAKALNYGGDWRDLLEGITNEDRQKYFSYDVNRTGDDNLLDAARLGMNIAYNIGNLIPYAAGATVTELGNSVSDSDIGRTLGITSEDYTDWFPFAEMTTKKWPWQNDDINAVDTALSVPVAGSVVKIGAKTGGKLLNRIGPKLAEHTLERAPSIIQNARNVYRDALKVMEAEKPKITSRSVPLAYEEAAIARQGAADTINQTLKNVERARSELAEAAFRDSPLPNLFRPKFRDDPLGNFAGSTFYNRWVRPTAESITSPLGLGMARVADAALSDGSNATDKDMEVLAQRAQAALQNQSAGSGQNEATLPLEAAQNASQISRQGIAGEAPQAAIPTLDEAVNNYTTRANELINAALDLPTEEAVNAELSQYMSPELVEAALQEYRARNDALTSMMEQQRIRDEERQNLRARLAAIRDRRGKEYDDNILNTVFRIFLGPVQALKFGKDPFQADNEAREYYITQDPEYQELIGLISDTQDLPSRKENMEALLGASRQKLGDILNVRGAQSDIARTENKRRNRNVVSVADQLKLVADLEAGKVNARTKAENAKINKLATQSMIGLRDAQSEQKRIEQLNTQFVNMVASFGEQEAIRRMIEIYGRGVLPYLVTSGAPTSGTSKYGEAMKKADRRQ